MRRFITMKYNPVLPEAPSTDTTASNSLNLPPQTSKLLNLIVTTPGLFEKIGSDREAFFSVFGDNLDSSDRRALELLAEVFLPDNGPAVPLIYNGCSCWTWVAP